MKLIARQRSMLSKSFLSLALCALLVAFSSWAQAQQPTKISRIGYIGGSDSAESARTEAFRQGLRDLGYLEGRNIIIEQRYAEGKADVARSLAAELVRLKTDVIVTVGSIPTRAAQEVTRAVPIVMAQDPDPVGNGFVASLARPGGNITGLSNLGPELSGKRLELLKEVLPSLTRVAIFGTSNFPGNAQILKETQRTAGVLKLQLQYVDVLDSKRIETAFQEVKKGHAEAVLVTAGRVFTSERPKLAAFAVKSRVPAIYYATEFVEDGGLMTYGANRSELSRRAATYVDKILKGASPAELPVEQPSKFEFIINLKAAKQIGLTIPPNVLARADRVIK